MYKLFFIIIITSAHFQSTFRALVKQVTILCFLY